MQLTDFIGFIISFLALAFLFFKQKRDKRFQQEHPKEYAVKQKKREQALKEYSKLMGIEPEEDVEEEEVVKKHSSHRLLQLHHRDQIATANVVMPSKEYSPPKRVNAPVYDVQRKRHSSVGRSLIDKLSSKQSMLIYKEIFDKPMALRRPDEPL